MLTEAYDQWSCNLNGYFCTVACLGDDVYWFSHTCPEDGECPPYGRVPYSSYYGEEEEHGNHHHALTAPVRFDDDDNISYGNIPLNHIKGATDEEIEFTRNIQSKYSKKDKDFLKNYGYDLRGIDCEIKDGKETCFLNHRLGRDICPPSVTSLSLVKADGQGNCLNEDTYCVVSCQDGTPFITWTAYNIKWCSEHPESCAPKPSVIPYDKFAIKSWSEPPKVPEKCESYTMERFRNLPPFTVGVLARGNEIDSLQLAVETWTKTGFMQYVDEFLFFINDRSDLIMDYLEPFTKSPYNIKIRSSEKNEGILKGIRYLIGNATNDHFLFLEKDFRITEPLECTLDQMQAGFDLILNGEADVVKYRSRYNGGKINWADVLYRDKEETVFQRQPNLLCNFYHWIDHPEERWPNHFKICHEDPIMYCVDAEFCNWTNNPFFIDKNWWIENYEKKHWEITDEPDGFDLETWMNWDPDAWNHRGWTIAEGAGMFKHADVHKFGV